VSEPASATATFLFTDIEGSTALLKQLRQRYAEVLVEHHRVLREAFAAFGGREIDNQGDAFFVVFRRAREAVLAAAAAQRRLAEHEWPESASVCGSEMQPESASSAAHKKRPARTRARIARRTAAAIS